MQHRRSNHIHLMVIDDNRELREESAITDHIVQYYKGLLGEEGVREPLEMDVLNIGPLLSHDSHA